MPAQAGIQGGEAGCPHTVPLIVSIRRTDFRHEPSFYVFRITFATHSLSLKQDYPAERGGMSM
jgi:hypothetical protein